MDGNYRYTVYQLDPVDTNGIINNVDLGNALKQLLQGKAPSVNNQNKVWLLLLGAFLLFIVLRKKIRF